MQVNFQIVKVFDWNLCQIEQFKRFYSTKIWIVHLLNIADNKSRFNEQILFNFKTKSQFSSWIYVIMKFILWHFPQLYIEWFRSKHCNGLAISLKKKALMKFLLIINFIKLSNHFSNCPPKLLLIKQFLVKKQKN